MARIYDLLPEDMARGVSVVELATLIHPEDGQTVLRRVTEVQEVGGLAVSEYRLRLPNGAIRRVLVRALYEPLQPGQRFSVARGIAVDLTGSQLGSGGGRSFFAAPLRASASDDVAANEPSFTSMSGGGRAAVERAADHVLALWQEIKEHPVPIAGLAETVQLSLRLIGNELARSSFSGDEGEHSQVPTITPPSGPLPTSLDATLAAVRVGTWERSIDGLVRCDATMAQLYGLPIAVAADSGIPMARFVGIVHPDDLDALADRNATIQALGGPIVLEYRIRPRPGVERWVMVRGEYDPALPGAAYSSARGIAIDLSRDDSHTAKEGLAYVAPGASRGDSTALDRMLNHTRALRYEAQMLARTMPGLAGSANLIQTLIQRHAEAAKAQPRDTRH